MKDNKCLNQQCKICHCDDTTDSEETLPIERIINTAEEEKLKIFYVFMIGLIGVFAVFEMILMIIIAFKLL